MVAALLTAFLVLVPTIIILQAVQAQTPILRCSQGSPPKEIKYHFTADCKQSKMKAILTKFTSTVNECQQLANKKRAFAINFVHKALLHVSALNFSKETCIVYECPEFGIRRDQSNSVYDYYSAYSRPSPLYNVSCIPKIGLYQLHRERENFQVAERTCEADGGSLADITSELHTAHLSSLLSTLNVSIAYVGLRQMNESHDEFLTSKGLPLSCLKYRAWAPNEPRPIRKSKCGFLTLNGYWKVKDCDRKLPFLCELKPQGPIQPCRHITRPRKKRRCFKTFLSSLPRKNRDPKCGDPSPKKRNEPRPEKRRRKQHRDYNNTSDESL